MTPTRARGTAGLMHLAARVEQATARRGGAVTFVAGPCGARPGSTCPAGASS